MVPNLLCSVPSMRVTELDALDEVGDTHPSATAVVRKDGHEILYVTKSNTDSLGVIDLKNNTKLPDFELNAIKVSDYQRFGPSWNRWNRWNPSKRWDRWKRVRGKEDGATDNVLYGYLSQCHSGFTRQ